MPGELGRELHGKWAVFTRGQQLRKFFLAGEQESGCQREEMVHTLHLVKPG